MMPTIETIQPGPAWQLALKRLLDIVLSGLLLLLLSPLLALIVLVVWITSGRPILYRWKVVGLGGRPFTGYKFRTMVKDADRLKAPLLTHNEMSGPVFKMKDDPRITPIGRVLRKFSLDEMPQLWSVLKGDMSIVGPRPPLQSEWVQFEEWQRRKLSVKPGGTCLWQISGRSDIKNFDEWVRMDLEYIDHWSLWLDIKIMLMSIPAFLLGKGAR